MDDILKPLIDSGEEVEWLGPASENSIKKVSTLLGARLPESLRQFLLKYGGGGLVGEPISGIIETKANSMQMGTLLGDTKRCRDNHRLPPHLIVVYYSEDGVCWCVDCGEQDQTGESPVVSFSIFTHKIDANIAPTFTEFLMEYVKLRVSKRT